MHQEAALQASVWIAMLVGLLGTALAAMGRPRAIRVQARRTRT